jgi:hypothetical protein
MSAPSPETTRVVTTPSVLVTDELATELVTRGGYTHPLFHPAEPAERPLPGQAVLLLMGGLVEQSGALDHAVAMLEIRSARFTAMVRPGTELHVDISLGTPEPTRTPGKARQVLTWNARDDDGTDLATAEVVMLVRHEPEETS